MPISSSPDHNRTEHRDVYYSLLSSQDPVVSFNRISQILLLCYLSLVALSAGDAKINTAWRVLQAGTRVPGSLRIHSRYCLNKWMSNGKTLKVTWKYFKTQWPRVDIHHPCSWCYWVTPEATDHRSFNKCSLSDHYMSGAFLGTGDTAVNKTDKNPCPHEACAKAGRQAIKYTHIKI